MGENVFNPIQFIIDELKRYQKLKAEGRLDEFEPKDKKSVNWLKFYVLLSILILTERMNKPLEFRFIFILYLAKEYLTVQMYDSVFII